MSVVEFVEKLLNILENQPQTVRWISNGTEFEIIDVDTFTHKILPHYFRHQKFQSFIRQLNMYGFHKVNRRKNSHIFQHQNFIQNKEENYRLIKRSKKTKAQCKTKNCTNGQINIDTSFLSQKAPKMAELLTKLIQFNTKNDFDHKKLKNKLDALSKQVSVKKQRNLRPIIKSIKQKILVLDQLQKKMLTINWSTLTSCPELEVSPTKTNNEPLDNGVDHSKRIMSAPVFTFQHAKQDNKGHEGGTSLNHIHSFGSISSFIVLG